MLTIGEANLVTEQWYRLFNRPDAREVRTIYDHVTTSDYRSYSGDGAGECWERETSIRVVESFATTIPDMQFAIRDLIVSGNQIVVRGEVSGTPALPLFSGRIPFSGKSFKVLAVDIHTVAEGRIQRTYHLENWFTAAQQLLPTVSPDTGSAVPEAITEAEVLGAYGQFNGALITGNLTTLEHLYADDYVLIRSDGQRLSKIEILNDIAQHSMRLTDSSTKTVKIKTFGAVGMMVADASNAFVRDGRESTARAQQTAVFVKSKGAVRLTHFQFTSLAP